MLQVMVDDGEHSKSLVLFQEKRAQKKGFLSTAKKKKEISSPLPPIM